MSTDQGPPPGARGDSARPTATATRDGQAPPPGHWGPTVRRRTRRPWRWVVFGVLGLVLAVVAFGVATALYADGRIERIPVEGLTDHEGPTNVLVVGSDRRSNLTPEQRTRFTVGEAGGDRTDTIQLISISGGRAAMLAFPRDLWVTRCDGSQGRINAAFQIGGPSCLVETVDGLSGIPIDHFLSVDFLGFVDIVDAVGGVEVCLERAISDPFAGVELPAGCHTLDGRQALGYVRVRKIDNDLERIKRQQTFLRSLADRLVSFGTVLNPPKVVSTLGNIGDALTADESLGLSGLARIGLGLRGVATGNVATFTVPVRGTRINGAAVMLPIENEAEALFSKFRDGSVLDEATAALQPGDVEVAVLNGAGIGGLAGRTAERLRADGFVVVRVADAPEPVETTTIRYPPGQRPAAELLAERFPGARLEEHAGGPVTVVAGPDADRAAPDQ